MIRTILLLVGIAISGLAIAESSQIGMLKLTDNKTGSVELQVLDASQMSKRECALLMKRLANLIVKLGSSTPEPLCARTGAIFDTGGLSVFAENIDFYEAMVSKQTPKGMTQEQAKAKADALSKQMEPLVSGKSHLKVSDVGGMFQFQKVTDWNACVETAKLGTQMGMPGYCAVVYQEILAY